MMLICKIQRHLVMAHRQGDKGEFFFVLCRSGLEKAIGKKLKFGTTVGIEVSMTLKEI